MTAFRFIVAEQQAGSSQPLAGIRTIRHHSRMSAASRALSSCLYIGTTTVLLLSACANARHQVAGHRFNVPAVNLISKSDYPFFLPKSQDEGFIFILDPQAELREQRTVLVQEKQAVCARANGGGYVSRTICGPRSIEWQGHGWVRSGDETFWTYSPDTPSGANAPFVSCHRMEIEGHSGLCKATLTLGDLVLTIGLNDDELPALAGIYESAASLLLSWEV